jgi:hypothetical protein
LDGGFGHAVGSRSESITGWRVIPTSAQTSPFPIPRQGFGSKRVLC